VYEPDADFRCCSGLGAVVRRSHPVRSYSIDIVFIDSLFLDIQE